MSQPSLFSVACPEHDQLLALAEGTLQDEVAEIVAEHVAHCETCDARLDLISEQSDTVVRALAGMPASEDDEETFVRLQRDLLSNPVPFTGRIHSDPTQALADQLPLNVILPVRLGNYDLLEEIGTGAHGAVFRAQHRRLEREVAIKLLLHAAGPFVEEFLNEMRVVGKLDHPNIIRATDAGEHDGTYFLVMEFVPGLDASSLLRQTGPLRVADACEVARQTALGLAFAHHHQLVHRDVKTSNLLFTSTGQIKLLDLGLATVASRVDSEHPQARSGPRGTADYMAPEQWRESSSVTHSADLYSLGCTFFKLLTGYPPFRDYPQGGVSKEQAHMNLTARSVTEFRKDVPPGVNQLIQSLLAKSPNERPESATAVSQQLAKFAQSADLPRLADKHCPAPRAEPAVVTTVAPTSKFDRRTVVAFVAGGILTIGATAMVLRPKKVPIDTETWRPLSPALPTFLKVSAASDARLVVDDNRFEIQSSDLSLLHLGNPIAKAYRWKSELQRESWATSAGIFFRLRKTEETEIEFQTIEIRSIEANRGILVWCLYRTGSLEEPIVLAEAPFELSENGRNTLEVTLGRTGFPIMECNGRRMPQSRWELSKEAREFVVTNVKQLPDVSAGRIGILQHGGSTLAKSELLYLKK